MNAPVDMARIGPGFADPVFDAQQTFRAMLAAMARPGVPQSLQTAIATPAGVAPTMTAMGLALLDGDVSVWLSPMLERDHIRGFLRFHTGCGFASTPDRADFALIGAPAELPSLADFLLGTDAYPDRSTTALVQVESLTGAPAWCWRGPGIRATLKRGVPGLPGSFLAQWQSNHARFPRGVDILFAAQSEILALPRSTRMSLE